MIDIFSKSCVFLYSAKISRNTFTSRWFLLQKRCHFTP